MIHDYNTRNFHKRRLHKVAQQRRQRRPLFTLPSTSATRWPAGITTTSSSPRGRRRRVRQVVHQPQLLREATTTNKHELNAFDTPNTLPSSRASPHSFSYSTFDARSPLVSVSSTGVPQRGLSYPPLPNRGSIEVSLSNSAAELCPPRYGVF
jgi:hypothetical protein